MASAVRFGRQPFDRTVRERGRIARSNHPEVIGTKSRVDAFATERVPISVCHFKQGRHGFDAKMLVLGVPQIFIDAEGLLGGTQ